MRRGDGTDGVGIEDVGLHYSNEKSHPRHSLAMGREKLWVAVFNIILEVLAIEIRQEKKASKLERKT